MVDTKKADYLNLLGLNEDYSIRDLTLATMKKKKQVSDTDEIEEAYAYLKEALTISSVEVEFDKDFFPVIKTSTRINLTSNPKVVPSEEGILKEILPIQYSEVNVQLVKRFPKMRHGTVYYAAYYNAIGNFTPLIKKGKKA